jgi:ribosomal subunit interface protein
MDRMPLQGRVFMQIRINSSEIPVTDAISDHVQKQVQSAMDAFEPRITRVEVHLHDTSGPKGGVDKKCLMEARPAGQQPLAVSDESDDLYHAISGAAGKLERAVRRRFERLDDR